MTRPVQRLVRCRACGAAEFTTWGRRKSQFGRVIHAARLSPEVARVLTPLCPACEKHLLLAARREADLAEV